MIKNILLDIDGVFWQGGKQIKGAQKTLDFIEKNNLNYFFLTNITRYTVQELSRKLGVLGVGVLPEKIISPVGATIEFIKSKNKSPACFLIAGQKIKEQFRESGIEVIEREGKADFVVVFLYEKTNYDMLDTAFRAVQGGAILLSNADTKYVSFRDNKPSLATGAFVVALEYASGKKAIFTGKQNNCFFESALKKLGAKPAETLMVGDSVSTDIAGAKKSGLMAVLVKTGSYNKEELKKSVLKPDALIDSIAGLPALLEKKIWRKHEGNCNC